MSLCDAVRNTLYAVKQSFKEDSPPCVEGEKVQPLRAQLDVESGGQVVGGSPTSGPSSPLMSMVTASSSPSPGGLAHLWA